MYKYISIVYIVGRFDFALVSSPLKCQHSVVNIAVHNENVKRGTLASAVI